MHIVDHIFILLLFVVQPIQGAITFRRYIARIKEGKPARRVRAYMETLAVEWAFLAALAFAWFQFGRPVADLGFVAPGGIGFWSGVGVFVLFTSYLIYAWHSAKHASDNERSEQAEELGDLVHFLPITRHHLRAFFAISITAGIVEEIVYRGFVLWYLAQFMPLWAAVVVSSVAFGLGHSYQGASGALRCGLIGLVFAIFYIVTGSIWLPIIAHAVLDILQGMMLFELFRDKGNDGTPALAGEYQ
jgi:membrane protease YdiL (CAAX protease family)